MIAPALAIALFRYGAVAALAPIFLSHLLLLYPTLLPNSQWWGPVFRSFTTQEKEVWLTIDDGPALADTARILALLDEYRAQATFFIIGQSAETQPHLITEILARGHQLANHTFTHPSTSFWCAGPQRIRREIDQCTRYLRVTDERRSTFFRAPVGLINPFVHPVLKLRGMQAVGWSARGYDAVRRDAQAVAGAITSQASPGAIILLHQGRRAADDADFHPRCIELVLQRLSSKGYRFIVPSPERLRTSAAAR
jgi:peptidoglycan/xylan/chitin deacetylase (PgdA/CDA1 family)